ncbi:MAG: glycosyltransferase family 4 protein [Deltaproteobacteria bacterium]|nr:glycosyltransferase family 4 protein [Deltaproteobacteria bacterium]
MKIAFLIHSLEVNSCRYRVLQYLPYLKEAGIEVAVHFYQRTWRDKLRFYNTLGQYDIFYIHRKLFPPLEFAYIREKAKKIIYDFDDAIMYRSSSSKNPYSLSRRIKFAYMMRRVDFIIAGNNFLKSEVLHYNPQVEVIPTSIDLSRYTAKEYSRHRGPVIVGWLGSSSTLKYLKNLMPALERLYQRYPHFQLKIVCDQFLDSVIVPVIKQKWSAETEEADLKSFDIGVMPLSDDLWSRGKCGLKILQYFSVGVPTVCAPVGVNRDIVQDKVNGFWAKNEKQWEDRLLTLIQKEGLRKEMGLVGRKTVENLYTVEVNAPRLLGILKKVYTRDV